jgi:hypothetical protein
MIRSAEERYPLATLLYEMSGGLVSRRHIVANHLRELVGKAGTGEKDDGYLHVI